MVLKVLRRKGERMDRVAISEMVNIREEDDLRRRMEII